MKKCNFKTTIAERGGMMIEALAMLGLIAVVTPTMYKKSAERTLEVEDINTAGTIRTYMGAAESYIATNYGDLLKNMEDNTSAEISSDDLKDFLPYEYQTGQSLYDYETPVIRAVRQGNNITAFALFPAKQSEDKGIGQERTARIASLVGSNGGYMTGEKKARGVGGLWSLDETAYDKVFPDNDDANTYSIVTASTAAINSSTAEAAVVDNTKYLQRTCEGNEDNPAACENDEKWRNAMRTDLYMGGYNNDKDKDSNDNAMHSIRNVNSLIIGGDNDNGYGLYVGDNKNAYVAGSFEALGGMLNVNSGTSWTGGDPIEAINFGTNREFVVDKLGNLRSKGNQILLGDVASGNLNVKVGKLGGDNALIRGYTVGSGGGGFREAHLSAVSDDIFKIQANTNGTTVIDPRITMMEEGGYKGADKQSGKNSLGGNIGVTGNYISSQTPGGSGYEDTFPVKVKSNMLVEGVLAAGQVDAQHLRMASLQAGSANINDQAKWLTVKAEGVTIEDTSDPSADKGKVKATFDASGMKVDTGSTSGTNASGNTVLDMGVHGTGASKSSHAYLHNDTTKLTMKNNELQFALGNFSDNNIDDAKNALSVKMKKSGSNAELEVNMSDNSKQRVITDGGNMDLIGTNFNVYEKDGSNETSIFAVRGNSNEESGFGTNYNNNSLRGTNPYNIAMNGSVLVSGKLPGKSDKSAKFVSVNNYNQDAGVNIISYDNDSYNQALVVDLDGSDAEIEHSSGGNWKIWNKIDGGDQVSAGEMEDGTVYVRKGMLAVTGDVNQARTNSADEGLGIVAANRFVANNLDASGNLVKVPDMLTNKEYKLYNNSSKNGRYDRYMVNPAYTSVMNDIKLTTRGGARLSDIMPDFITKGIYVASNDRDDVITEMRFETESTGGDLSSFKIVDKDGHEYTNEAVSSSSNETAWASPYVGVVPAPQCPPGYMRVVTVTPAGFQMSQAGDLSLAHRWDKQGADDDVNPNYGTGLFVNEKKRSSQLTDDADLDTIINTSASTDSQLGPWTPGYEQAEVGATGVGLDTGNAYISTDGEDITAYDLYGISTTKYTLTVDKVNGMRPLVFQQSTWLKALVVPFKNDTRTQFSQTPQVYQNNDEYHYTRGWAVLMGFIYPDSVYGGLIGSIGHVQGSTNKYVSLNAGEQSDLYWNIFPVRKNTIEGYVTTYCYFDRSNIGSYKEDGTRNGLGYRETGNDDCDSNGCSGVNYQNYIDAYDVVTDNIPSTYEPTDSSKAYRQKLNDPSLKYDELW